MKMADVEDILAKMRREPTSVRFAELVKVCEAHLGKARQAGSSHMIFKMPWQGDPRVDIQNDRGKAKAYQMRQVLAAVDRLAEEKK